MVIARSLQRAIPSLVLPWFRYRFLIRDCFCQDLYPDFFCLSSKWHYLSLSSPCLCPPPASPAAVYTPLPDLAGPPELAYGDSKRSELITPGAVLIFELDLIEVQGPAAAPTTEL